MENTSVKLVFLLSLIIPFCSYLVDAREMTEVNCLGGKCPEGKKNCNCLSPVTPMVETNVVCHKDDDCKKYCPKGCKPSNPCVCTCTQLGECLCQCQAIQNHHN
ncbi:unnamed protein product [Brassica rapa]|uniref:Defensin-like protein 263 n=4 Tax=Brassica TaxID=3705 RepID=A0A8D9HQ66_BRACM|nr:unnamed protein product [Brassica napus]CAG7903748.1 unnamed protein product [Brassica rapa]